METEDIKEVLDEDEKLRDEKRLQIQEKVNAFDCLLRTINLLKTGHFKLPDMLQLRKSIRFLEQLAINVKVDLTNNPGEAGSVAGVIHDIETEFMK